MRVLVIAGLAMAVLVLVALTADMVCKVARKVGRQPPRLVRAVAIELRPGFIVGMLTIVVVVALDSRAPWEYRVIAGAALVSALYSYKYESDGRWQRRWDRHLEGVRNRGEGTQP